MTLLEQLRKAFGRTESAASANSAAKLSLSEPLTPFRLPDAPDVRRSVRLTLGLDFGTSSTKAVVNFEDAAAERDHFAVVQHTDGNEASLLYPSAVALCDGVLLTGGKADARRDAIRSFKMCIPCACGMRRVTPCANCPAGGEGRYSLGGHELDAIDVSILYLAIVIKQVKTELSSHKPDCRFTWHMNCAAPLNQSETDHRLSAAFDGVFYHAWRLSEQAQAHWRLEDALPALKIALALPVPPTAESPIMVFPETHAAMTAYILAPDRPAGLYATVDVGAGTTDVAFFWCGDQSREDGTRVRVASFHAYLSKFVGMDDVDRALGIARSEREQSQHARLAELQHVYAGVLEEIYRHYGRTFGAAYANATDQRYWVEERNEHQIVDDDGQPMKIPWWYRPKEIQGRDIRTRRARYRLCLVGGGTRMQAVVEKLKRPLDYLGFQTVDVDQPCLPDRVQILASNGQRQDVPAILDQQLPLLLLAYGLAHRAIDIPLWERGRGGRQELVYVPQVSHEEIYG